MSHQACRHVRLRAGCVYCTRTRLVYIRADDVILHKRIKNRPDDFRIAKLVWTSIAYTARDLDVSGICLIRKDFKLPQGPNDYQHLLDLLIEIRLNKRREKLQREVQAATAGIEDVPGSGELQAPRSPEHAEQPPVLPPGDATGTPLPVPDSGVASPPGGISEPSPAQEVQQPTSTKGRRRRKVDPASE